MLSEPGKYSKVILPIIVILWLLIDWIYRKRFKDKESSRQVLKDRLDAKDDLIKVLEEQKNYYKPYFEYYNDLIQRQGGDSKQNDDKEGK